MLDKNREFAVPSSAPPQGTASQSITIQKPGSDWMPVRRAPLCYGPEGYIRTQKEWVAYIEAKLLPFAPGDWSVKHYDWAWSITWEGLTTEIDRKYGVVSVSEEGEFAPIYVGTPDEFSVEQNWVEYRPELRVAAKEHRHQIAGLLDWFWYDFVRAGEAGAAEVMARKNTVFAPLERVLWEQWSYFRVDEAPEQFGRPWQWLFSDSRLESFSTATGPTGERLFSIYIRPGVATISDSSATDTSEEKCLQWIIKLLRDFPDRSPKPLRDLAREAVIRFPGLSLSRFRYCYFLAQVQTGNRNWPKARRPPGSSKKSSHKN
jgi:hypothetical protein